MDYFYEHNCLYFKQKAQRRSIIVEGKQFFLSFPEILFVANCLHDSAKFKMTHYTYVSFYVNKKYYKIPLYNIYDGGLVCLGNPYQNTFNSLKEIKEFILTNFWKRSFKYEYSSAASYLNYKKRKLMISDLNKWQEKTKKNKKWVPSARNLIEVGPFTEIKFEAFERMEKAK